MATAEASIMNVADGAWRTWVDEAGPHEAQVVAWRTLAHGVTESPIEYAQLLVARVVLDWGIMRALGALLLITGSLTACGGHVIGTDPGPGGSSDGSVDSGTGVTSAMVDSGSGDSATGNGLASDTDALSCEPAFVEAGTGLAGNAEVPIYHRATPACCPSERGPAPLTQPYGSGTADGCSSDSECTGGADGRCFPFEGLVGAPGCSYDQCFTDSDCPSGTPCLCRSSPADNSPNVCVPGGNCVLDSDCGPGG